MDKSLYEKQDLNTLMPARKSLAIVSGTPSWSLSSMAVDAMNVSFCSISVTKFCSSTSRWSIANSASLYFRLQTKYSSSLYKYDCSKQVGIQTNFQCNHCASYTKIRSAKTNVRNPSVANSFKCSVIVLRELCPKSEQRSNTTQSAPTYHVIDFRLLSVT